MKIRKITAAYFSPTGNVEKVAKKIGRIVAETLGAAYEEFDFLTPEARYEKQNGTQSVMKNVIFDADELLVIGVPVYAGRVPNKILPFIREGFKVASGSYLSRRDLPLCIPFVCFGNRSFGDGLSELVMEMRNNGFAVPGAAAVVSEHSFCDSLAPGRPDENDMLEIGNFARSVCEKITGDKTPSGWSGNDDPGRLDSADSSDTHPAYREIKVPGNTPPGPYYTPRKVDGEPAVFLKAKPRTDSVKCDMCGKCAEKCPMGSIAAEDPAVVYGICIKCQACVKICPQNAKYFDDPDFLSHKEMLAQNYERRAESVFVL